MPRTTHTYAELELTQSAYDEIEAKLLAAGYEHLFAAGPGSAIDLQGIAVTCKQQAIKWLRVNGEPFEYAIQQGRHGDEFVHLPDGSCKRRPIPEIERSKVSVNDTGNGDYCFMCDETVSAPCDRENCLRRANDRVRAELGLVP